MCLAGGRSWTMLDPYAASTAEQQSSPAPRALRSSRKDEEETEATVFNSIVVGTDAATLLPRQCAGRQSWPRRSRRPFMS
jgi:hypothetical protein